MKKDSHRGRYELQDVLRALDQTRIKPDNRKTVIQYLVYGVRLRDLVCSRQQAWNRINKTVKLLCKDE